MVNLHPTEVQTQLGGIFIPPRPAILSALYRAQDAGNMKEVIWLIEFDMGLSAAVMKAINSAFFGFREKISTIPWAVNLLGLQNVVSLAMGLSLRKLVVHPRMEIFWEDSERTALVSAYLARSLGCLDKHQLHLYGLFQDVGKVLMLLNFPNYTETLRLCQPGESLTRRELLIHRATHGQMGSMLARSWNLPDRLCNAMEVHAYFDVFVRKSSSPEVRNLIALTRLAKIMAVGGGQFDFGDSEFDRFNAAVIDHFGLGRDELDRLFLEVNSLLKDDRQRPEKRYSLA